MKKIIIKVILILLVVFFVFPVVLMFAVNLGLTKEKSGIGRVVDLQKKDDLVFETTKNEVESKEPVTENIFFKKDTNGEIKLKYCKKEILTAIDNALNFVRESNVNEIFSHKKSISTKKLTENKNYYHQYLYTGLAIKMIKKQWKKRGYYLDDKLGIIATIYNLGLKKSNPNAYPGIGGAEIYIDGKKWYFGELGEKIWISLQRYKGEKVIRF